MTKGSRSAISCTTSTRASSICDGGSDSNLHSKHGSIRKRQYKGVRMRSWGSWVSEIRAPNQKTRIWLGSYSTAEAAARAYDAALVCLKGSSADLNFPDAVPSHCHHLPGGTVMSPKSIQRVAAAAAYAVESSPPHHQQLSPQPFPSPSTSSSETTIAAAAAAAAAEDIRSPGLADEMADAAAEEMLISRHRLTELLTDFGAFSSPKIADLMLSGCSPFSTAEMEWEEEVGIYLWSF